MHPNSNNIDSKKIASKLIVQIVKETSFDSFLEN